MRFIGINKIQCGDKLGKTLYDNNGTVLLHQGTTLSDSLLCRLKAMNYNGLYIEDELSEGIVMEDVVEDKLRIETTAAIRKIMVNKEGIAAVFPLLTNIVNQILKNQDMLLQMNRLQNYHDYTYIHCVNVGILAIRIGIAFKLKEEELKNLGIAGILHDIGKQEISLDIIDKNGRLTDEEFHIIKKHPKFGFDLLTYATGISSISKVGILDHHERYKGDGYPRDLKGEDISLFGRIIAVADNFDAMASDRSYRKALPAAEIIEYLMGNAGIMFDYKIVDKFVKSTCVYPTGGYVELSDGKHAIVVKNYHDSILRPVIRLVETKEEIDLKNDTKYLNLCISKVLSQ